MKFLLLEDNINDAGLTIRALEKSWSGCVIRHASTIHEAMNVLKNDIDLDVAVLDLQLPDGSGMEVLNEIRRSGADIAVTMLTGSGSAELAVAALKAGADDYMVKQPGYVAKIKQSVEIAIANLKHCKELESRSIHVLHVEHNASDVELTLRHMNKYAPYIKLENVVSAEQALSRLTYDEKNPGTWKYHVILMDYRLPGINALEFIKIIRQERKLEIPVIIVTGQDSEDIAIQALKIGATEYLVKRDNYIARLPPLIYGAWQYYELKHKQRELEESEAKYRLIAENSGDVIFTLDFDLKYTYISPAIYTLLGLTPQEMQNQSITEGMTPESYRKVKEMLDNMLTAIQSGDGLLKPVTIELEMYKVDRTMIWVEIKATVSTDVDGNPAGILGVSRDITRRKKLKDDLRKLSSVIKQSTESVTITDVNGNIEYVNPKFTELTGYLPEEVMGKNPRILNSGHHKADLYRELWETILEGKDWHGEILNRNKNGALYWVRTSIFPLRNENGRISHFVALKEDITQQKNLFEDLKRAKERAEESDRLKTAFLANMSHEIRTPMNGILGFTALLSNPDLTSQEKDIYIEIVHKSGQRMMNTVNDIVEISKIEAGLVQIQSDETDVNSSIEELVRFFRPEAEKKGLTLTVKALLPAADSKIITDSHKLDSILTNLIKNAIKFTDKGGITVECRLQKANAEFIVKDTGIGIPVERQEAVFNRFEQADISEARAFEGSGLGLAISKAYVDMLGGEIRVESVEDKGSTFFFTIPYTPVEKEQSLPSQNKIILKDVEGMKILIAEDDAVSYLYLNTVLKEYGIQTLHVLNGEEAVQAMKQHQDISLLLMDIRMPVMDGFEATRRIRSFNKKVPIIAQTAYAFDSDKEEVIKAGCNDYISKPIDEGKLQQLILKHITKKDGGIN